MSKNSKGQNDDVYAGEDINYEDYYLDDEDYYLDDDEDIDDSSMEKDSGENKTVEEDQEKKAQGSAAESEKTEKITVRSEAEKKEREKAQADTGKKEADRKYQIAGDTVSNVEVQGQEAMKKENVKGSSKKTGDKGKAEAGKKKNGQGKTGAQKSGTGKTGAKKSDTGKKAAQKGGQGKTTAQKNNIAKSGPGKSGPGKSRPPKNGAGRSGAKKTNGSGAGRRSKKSGAPAALIAAGVFMGLLAVGYVGIATYFSSHFYMNTEINGHDFSMKTTADVKQYMEEQVKGYTLTILEKDNRTDTISGEDISLEYKENKDIKNVLKRQNAFLWPQALFVKNSSKATVEVSYDRDALESQIKNLQAVKVEQTPPVSAYPKFNGTEYDVEPEVTGTEVDMDILREKIHQYISEFEPELDMVEEQCYALPKYTSESGDVRAACNEMNQYLKASITYSMNEPVVVDKTLIATWVSVDDNMKVTFDEGAVREWLKEFGKQYDTVGKTRSITSPWGKTVDVSGGTYGWSVDEDAEFPALVESIKKGETVTREPIYCAGQTAASRGPQDWGNTYAEVDLSGQHMWYIVDGAVALETDVVTGVPVPEKETPSGVYSILEKELNSTLVGEIVPSTGQPEYRTVVAYWMRVTWSGIGFHDATWQPAFGGSLYASGAGSHGCINMPINMAASLYDMMPVGTPVIIHY